MFEDPIVGDAIRVHRFWPNIEHAVGTHPSALIVDAVSHYHAALESAQADRMKRERPGPGPPTNNNR